MNKIDELLDNYQLNDDIDIELVKVDDIELNRIKRLTLEKTGIKPSNKAVNKRIIIPLAAVITLLILSMAVASANGSIQGIFGGLFAGGYQYVEDCSEIVDVFEIDNNVKISIDGIIGDENSAYLRLTAERIDGKSLNCSYASFDNVDIDLRGSGGFSYHMIEDENPDDNKISFLFGLSITKGFRNRDIELDLKNIELYYNNKNNVFNPYEYLCSNENLINQNNITNTNVDSEKELLGDENISEDMRGKITKEVYSIEKALGRNDLGLEIIRGNNQILVDNVGFVDNRLNIRVAIYDEYIYDIGEMYFKGETADDVIYPYIVRYNDGNTLYKTFIFDIADMDKLRDYSFICYSVETVDKIQASWNLKFKPNYRPTIKSQSINKTIELDGYRYKIKKIKLSPISVVIDINRNLIDKINHPVNSEFRSIKVILDNGEEIMLNGANISSNMTKICIIKKFSTPVDVEAIKEVIIEDYSFSIEK